MYALLTSYSGLDTAQKWRETSHLARSVSAIFGLDPYEVKLYICARTLSYRERERVEAYMVLYRDLQPSPRGSVTNP